MRLERDHAQSNFRCLSFSVLPFRKGVQIVVQDSSFSRVKSFIFPDYFPCSNLDRQRNFAGMSRLTHDIPRWCRYCIWLVRIAWPVRLASLHVEREIRPRGRYPIQHHGSASDRFAPSIWPSELAKSSSEVVHRFLYQWLERWSIGAVNITDRVEMRCCTVKPCFKPDIRSKDGVAIPERADPTRSKNRFLRLPPWVPPVHRFQRPLLPIVGGGLTCRRIVARGFSADCILHHGSKKILVFRGFEYTDVRVTLHEQDRVERGRTTSRKE
jgi:hypothetical protein